MTRLFSWFFSAVALTAMVVLFGIFAWQSLPVWQHAGAGYVTGEKWFYRSHLFGALSMIYGTFVVAGIALLIAAPVGVGTAVFVAEYLPRRLRIIIKAALELLAGIPSVVYGLLGIALLRNWIYDTFESFELLSGDTLLTAGLLLAIMVLPTVITLADDALSSVPAAQRRAARSLGLSRAEAILTVSLPQARRGLGAALLLALGRSLGETIAVFLVVGRQDNNLPHPWFTPRALLEAGQTLASKLGSSETNIAYGDRLHWAAMMGLGLLLLVITAALAFAATSFRRKADA